LNLSNSFGPCITPTISSPEHRPPLTPPPSQPQPPTSVPKTAKKPEDYIHACPVPRPSTPPPTQRFPPRHPRHRYRPFFTHTELAEQREAKWSRQPTLVKRVIENNRNKALIAKRVRSALLTLYFPLPFLTSFAPLPFFKLVAPLPSQHVTLHFIILRQCASSDQQ